MKSTATLKLQTTKLPNYLNFEPTKSTERKVQRYPTGSCPGKFYGIARLHKIQPNGHVDDLPIRPIVLNISTAIYNLSNYLAKMLAPLRKSQYSLKNTKDFTNKIKTEKIPTGYQMVSFDVKSLFTNVPLDRTIDIILQRIFDTQEIQTKNNL